MKILSAVYNPIAYDGRVQRECEALSQISNLELLCPAGPLMPQRLPFNVRTVRLASGPGQQFWRHLQFSSALIRLARRIRPDVIHAHDYFMAAPGIAAAAISKAALIYDAHELIIPDAVQAMSRRAWFWYRLERLAVARADLVIAANDDRSRLMCEHYRLRKEPLVVRNIPPHAISEEEVEPVALKRSAGERLCVYQGDISFKRGLDRLLTAVPLMPGGIRLIIVGGGPDADRVRSEVSRLRIEDRVTMLGRVRRDELHAILRACDVGVLLYPFEGLNNIYCAPNKLFEYAQAGLPVVATDQPPLAKILAGYDVGATFGRLDDPRAIASKVVSVLANQSLYRDGLKRLLNENKWSDEAERLQNAVIAMRAKRRMP